MTAMKCGLQITSGRKERMSEYITCLAYAPLDVDEGIVEQAKLMGIHIIRRAELKTYPPAC
jgi:hypothetical protein